MEDVDGTVSSGIGRVGGGVGGRRAIPHCGVRRIVEEIRSWSVIEFIHHRLDHCGPMQIDVGYYVEHQTI